MKKLILIFIALFGMATASAQKLPAPPPPPTRLAPPVVQAQRPIIRKHKIKHKVKRRAVIRKHRAVKLPAPPPPPPLPR